MKKSNLFIKLIALSLAALCALSLVSCSKDIFKGVESSESDLRVVGTIGDYQVCYDEIYYLIMSCKDIMKTKYGSDIWKTEASAKEYADELRSMVMERITLNYTIFILGEEYGIKKPLKNEEVIEYVDDKKNEALYEIANVHGISVTLEESLNGELVYKYEKGGYDKALGIYNDALKETYLTERVLRLTLAADAVLADLPSVLSGKSAIIYSDEDIEKYMFSDDFACYKKIQIDGVSDASLAKAQLALAELKSGASVDDVIKSNYNDDINSTPAGYYISRKAPNKEYADIVFDLDVDEISGIVKLENEYVIIQRCEKSSSYMLGNIDMFSQDIIEAQINEMLTERQEKLSLDLSDFGKSLEFHKIAVAEENKGDNK